MVANWTRYLAMPPEIRSLPLFAAKLARQV